MRWDRLFADLSADLDAQADAELETEIADRTRYERAQLRLVDRLRGAAGLRLDIRIAGVGTLSGVLGGVGPDWCMLRTGDPGAHPVEQVVRLGAVLEVRGLATYSATPGSEGAVAARFSLAAVARHLARDRAVVTLIMVDGGQATGTVEMAGADIVELSGRRVDDMGWDRATREAPRRTIPLEAIAVIRQ